MKLNTTTAPNILFIWRSRLRACIAGGLALLFLLALPVMAMASTADRLAAANRDYAAQRYQKALEGYRQLTDTAGYSPAVLFNMGNAYYRLGQIGMAIVCYERGRLLAPDDADILRNLAHVRQEAGLIVAPPPWWRNLFYMTGMPGWKMTAILAWVGLGAFWLTGALLARRCAPGGSLPPRKAMLTIKIGMLACLLIGVYGMCGFALAWRDARQSVIVCPQPRLQVSPFPEAETQAGSKPGQRVAVLKSYEHYRFIRLPNGKTGWIDQNCICPVIPADTAPADTRIEPHAAGSNDTR